MFSVFLFVFIPLSMLVSISWWLKKTSFRFNRKKIDKHTHASPLLDWDLIITQIRMNIFMNLCRVMFMLKLFTSLSRIHNLTSFFGTSGTGSLPNGSNRSMSDKSRSSSSTFGSAGFLGFTGSSLSERE